MEGKGVPAADGSKEKRAQPIGTIGHARPCCFFDYGCELARATIAMSLSRHDTARKKDQLFASPIETNSIAFIPFCSFTCPVIVDFLPIQSATAVLADS